MDPVVAQSREIIRHGSKSFAVAARLMSPAVRESVYQLYAWCRYCDDVIDDQDLGRDGPRTSDSIGERLEGLRRDTRAALDGDPPDRPVFIALSRVVRRHAIPDRHPLDLLRGFEMDACGRTYEQLDDVLEYCYHVAGVVGVMMALVMDARDADALRRASDLGLALQLTNIARDVMDDAAAGRVYLPGAWLAEAGVPRARLAEIDARPAVFAVVNRLLTEADRYYASAEAGLPALGVRSAWAVATARDVYRDIGSVVRRRGASAWDQRAFVSKPRKILRVMTGGVSALRARTSGRVTRWPARDHLWTPPALA